MEEMAFKCPTWGNIFGNHPLKFHSFDARKEHEDTPFVRTYWVLALTDILPKSGGKSWGDQVALIKALSKKSRAPYEAPTLQQIYAIYMTHYAATEECLYDTRATRVKETGRDVFRWHLTFSGSPSGIDVDCIFGIVCGGGVTAIRRL